MAELDPRTCALRKPRRLAVAQSLKAALLANVIGSPGTLKPDEALEAYWLYVPGGGEIARDSPTNRDHTRTAALLLMTDVGTERTPQGEWRSISSWMPEGEV